ncbi:hypothetical protein D3C75_1251470 [compost metagenome]
MGNRRDVQRAVVLLSAGHGHGVVEQNLEGDVGTCCNCRPDTEVAGVKVSAVADVLKHVFALGKRRLSDPHHAFAAHMGITHG